MLNRFEAKIAACEVIADIVGLDYFKAHIKHACESYPSEDEEGIDYEYFLGFDDIDDDSDVWNVFARVSVNRDTKEVTILDYKTPDGHRMENPIKPTSFA